MYQAGIKNITLYENTGIDFYYYDPLNLRAISNLEAAGAILTISNDQRPKFDIKIKFSKGGNVTQEFMLDFLLLGLTLDNFDLASQIKKSIYGWCFLVEFYDGTFKFYNTPLFCRESEIKPHDEMSFKIPMQGSVQTTEAYYEYTNVPFSTTPVYRWDSEVLTWDSTIYTFDYDL